MYSCDSRSSHLDAERPEAEHMPLDLLHSPRLQNSQLIPITRISRLTFDLLGSAWIVCRHKSPSNQRINAMEVSGIHGSYKRSCEIAMEVLRDNKDSLMAVLEAFVYDPLIAWRLVPTNNLISLVFPLRSICRSTFSIRLGFKTVS
jgi:hypothetical protein